MDAEAIQKIVEMVPPTVNAYGEGNRSLTYSNRTLIPVMEPMDSHEEVITLTGLVDLMKAKINGAGWDNLYVHVASPKRVSVSQLTCDKWGRRQTHILCTLPDYGKFQFGQYMGQEAFIIGANAFFVRENSADLGNILSIAAKLKAELVSEGEDNGLSQSVTLRKGPVLAEKATIKKIVNLRPYRTFREVEQPESAFIFRLKSNEGELPSLALHVADAEMWQAAAMQSIKAYLAENLKGLTVVA